MSEAEQTMRPQIGEFSWNELVTTDAKAAEGFYSKVFGWKTRLFKPEATPPGAPPYTIFFTDPNTMGVGGMTACPAPGIPAHWQAYVVVPSVDATLALAQKLGGKVLMPAMDIPDVGRIALIQDPQGAALGLHQLPG